MAEAPQGTGQKAPSTVQDFVRDNSPAERNMRAKVECSLKGRLQRPTKLQARPYQ